jgi:hypothetical protein
MLSYLLSFDILLININETLRLAFMDNLIPL